MKGFLRSLSLLLAGALAGVLGYCYYFNIPINFNPITVVNTGDGDVEIDNRVNQGGIPAPSPSPVAPQTPAATPAPPPKTAENEPEQSAPPPEPRRPEVAETDEGEIGEAAPEQIRRRSPRPATTGAPVFEEQPRPVYTSYPQQPPVRRRSCPIVVVRRAAPPAYDEADIEPQPPPAYPSRTYSRSYSSSVVTVNGRVVSSSSVTTVNGRVVSRSGVPSTPVDDDEW